MVKFKVGDKVVYKGLMMVGIGKVINLCKDSSTCWVQMDNKTGFSVFEKRFLTKLPKHNHPNTNIFK